MEKQTVALFGEAEKGDFQTIYHCKNLQQLSDNLGHPPPYSRGIFMAIQALLFDRELVFIRVRDEGYSFQDYYKGLRLLTNYGVVRQLAALGMPGVGDSSLVEATTAICAIYASVLITTEDDLYDYLTTGNQRAA
ncbi:MAG: hypothetical protein Q8K75_09240 [Chlamydiales bacterium]|nr:hypothetical protein [Chlamydiales bacterium]